MKCEIHHTGYEPLADIPLNELVLAVTVKSYVTTLALAFRHIIANPTAAMQVEDPPLFVTAGNVQ